MKRIVIKLHLESDRCRSKALRVAAKSQGVKSLSLEGESCNQLVVIGDEVDAVCLTNQLRKKFRYAMLLNVEDIVEDCEDEGDVEDIMEDCDENDTSDYGDNEKEREISVKDESDETRPMENHHPLLHYHYHNNYIPFCPMCDNNYSPPSPVYHRVVYDHSYPNTCSIL